jgi:hypothetical protein
MRGLFVIVCLLAGCQQTPAEKAQDVCQAYCDCIDPGAPPATEDQCIAQQCLPNIPPVTDDCLDCVFAHDQVCTDLYADCTDLCLSQPTDLLGGF